MAAKFDPKEHMTKLQGREYLEVKWRLVWFRETYPTGAISTDMTSTDQLVIVRATVHGTDGALLASGYGTAPVAGKGTWTGRAVEKAETAAIGRALAHAGFGTQFDADDETDNLADSPIQPAPDQPAPDQPAANGWTRDQANSLITEATAKGVTTDELLTDVLKVSKISEYAPGFSAARAKLTEYAKSRKAQPAPLMNGGAK